MTVAALEEEEVKPMTQLFRVSREINELTWRAFTDASFCEGLLNGCRREIVSTLDLTDAEREAVLNAQADTLEDFCRELCQIAGDSSRTLLFPANHHPTAIGIG